MRFGSPAAQGDLLTITGPPFSFPAAVDLSIEIVNSDTGQPQTIGADFTISDGLLLEAKLLSALQVNVLYSVRFKIMCGPSPDNSEMWHVETRRTTTELLPQNTNDAQTPGFKLMIVVLLKISVGRVAPRTDADLEIVIDPQGSAPTQFVLYAPPGFIFPTGSCLRDEPGPSSKILSCRRLQESNIVELQLAGDGLQVAARANIIIRAPDTQNDQVSNMWLIQAVVQGQEVGWGEFPGFAVVHMSSAQLVYGGAPSTTATMAIIFTTTQQLYRGGLEIISPEVYKLSCRVSEGFNPISIPGIRACDDAGIGLRLTLNATMPPGSYAFMVGSTNPAYTPARNLFSVLLKDQSGNVIDARMEFAGQRIVSGLYVSPPLLQFSSSASLAESEIRITFRVSESLDPLAAIGAIRALQFAVPERFTLITRFGVQNLDGIATPETGWYHLYYAQRLVRVDLVANEAQVPKVIAKGDYGFAFKVRLPEFLMPKENIWRLSLCRDLRCTDLIAVLPIAGFNLGDTTNLEATTSTEGVSKSSATKLQPQLCCSHVVLAVLLFLVCPSTPKALGFT